MSVGILDGRALARQKCDVLKKKLSDQLALLKNKQLPCLVVISVGDDPASNIYIEYKRKCCEQVGIDSKVIKFTYDVSEYVLVDCIDHLNKDSSVHGILVQLPLPHHIISQHIIEAIAPHKDVDGFHPYNIGRLALKHPVMRPCTPYGIMQLLNFYGIDILSKKAVVVGASNIVGRPMALELLLAGATVTICHSKTKNLHEETLSADILIVAVGVPHLIQGDWIKQGAVVIDVGIHRLPNGQLCGDVEPMGASQKASWLSPVPGGVGPMTVVTLIENTVCAWEKCSE
jgi:methylenetetrahydrofolate dehydrogenase (NADP+)/methenyltetrahydrofolate cyclohydrolase